VTVRAGAATLALAAGLLVGCGGGAPLLHPAHALPEGDVTFAAGTSGRFTMGGLKRAEARLDDAGRLPGGAQDAAERRDFAKGSISRVAVGPGVAPFVAARIGLGNHREAGLTYVGRGFRLDGRHAFEWPSLALSFGVAGNVAFSHSSRDLQPVPGTNTGLRTMSLSSLKGFGLELPMLFGYRSSADVVKLWAGLRAGFERDYFNASIVVAPDTPVGAEGRATRYFAGGLVGFAIGLSPIEVRAELDAAYESARGTLWLSSASGDLVGDVAGWSLTPAMAISAKF